MNDVYTAQPNPKIMMKLQWIKPVIIIFFKTVCSVIVSLEDESHIFDLYS